MKDQQCAETGGGGCYSVPYSLLDFLLKNMYFVILEN